MTDEELANRAAAGDQEAFASLYERYKRALFNYAWRVVGEAGLAEDATQEALISAFRYIKNFDPGRGSFRSWVFAIAHNESRHALTARGWWHRGRKSGDEILSNQTCPADAAASMDAKLDLERALQQLPEAFRLPLILSKVHGLSIQECAVVLGLSEVNIKQRVFRAVQRLRRFVTNCDRHSHE